MSKAFDKVRHSIILKKLHEINIRGNLHSWFGSYLLGRRQRVTIPGATSPTLPVTSGVPQGSILGPILFLLYANDLSDSVLYSNVACFADDTKLIKTINSSSDAALLQEDINRLDEWSLRSGICFNEAKTKSQSITRKKAPVTYTYHLRAKSIEKLESERDLGIWISTDLTWSKQTVIQATAANRMLGSVRRCLREITDPCVRRTVYLALVRPHLGYATQIWSPQSIELIRRVEQVQRRATKVILNLPFRTPITYKQRLISLNLLPFTYWHEYLDLVFFFKAVNSLAKIDPIILPTPYTPTRTTRNSSIPDVLYFRPRKCRTLTFQRSFFNRMCRTWNVLPCEMRRKGVALSAFKGDLLFYYQTTVTKLYDPEDPTSWKTICLKCNTARNLTTACQCCN